MNRVVPTDRALRPAFVVGGLHTEASGVARIVCDLANAMARSRHPVTVFTARCGDQEPLADLLESPNRLVAERGHDLGRLAWSPRLRRRLKQELASLDVVHQHSLWMLPNHYASQVARDLSLPVLFTANGFLEPWALDHSRWKKRLVGAFFQWRDLRRASCIHVNSVREANNVRALGMSNPLVVIPNGVDCAPFDARRQPARLFDRFPVLARRRNALFLSRLHRKKGILELIEAWSDVHGEFGDWHLMVAGPDDGAGAQVRQRIDELGLEGAVTILGPVTGTDKLEVLAASELFLLPSHSEGFSMALLEAMAARLPVLSTPGCNFPEIVAAEAGVEVAPDAQSLAQALRGLLSQAPEALHRMGGAGRRLVEERYTWQRTASDLLAVYAWMTGRGEEPRSLYAA